MSPFSTRTLKKSRSRTHVGEAQLLSWVGLTKHQYFCLSRNSSFGNYFKYRNK